MWDLDYERPVIEKSKELLSRAQKTIPSAAQTLSKSPGQHVRGVAPVFLEKGKGARVTDVDGNEFLDFSMAVGPICLGYGYPKVDEAIRRQLKDGITFSLPHPLEVEVAELLCQVIPGAEKVRFSKTGADVTSAAVRIARAFTDREKVVCCGYHGWHDWFIGSTSRGAGVPAATKALVQTFRYNDLDSLKSVISNETACVVMEPMLFEEPDDKFLFEVKNLCRKHGALLIFDEMWTGFRFALGGAQEYFDIQADLVTFSKAIANGMPLSALCGRADVMDLLDQDTNCFFSNTFGGEALSLAAAKATIEEIRDNDVCAHLHKLGKLVRSGYNAIAVRLDMEFTDCIGLGCRTTTAFAELPLIAKSFVQQELIKRGILWSGQHVISYSHTEQDIDQLLDAYSEILPVLKFRMEEGELEKHLEGEPIVPVFRTVTDN